MIQFMAGLYVHIPFCVRKCLYCDFYSLPQGDGPLPGRLNRLADADNGRFLDALEVELRSAPAGFRPATVFIGGGTPTELSDRDFARLLEILRREVDFSGVEEWTCESNPGTLTPAKAESMREAGVNRVSLGVQSFDAGALEFLGRIHTAEEAEQGYRLLRDAGFQNINLDLMYGIPGVSTDRVRRDVEQLARLGPDHASAYCLTFEEGTPLWELRAKGLVRETDEAAELEQYEEVRRGLRAAGYGQYEISNFARPGRECRHNLLYWGGGEYIGCGPSAHSHWGGVRSGNVRSLAAYTERWLAGQPARDFEERLDPEPKARETLVMWLRRLEGVSRSEFKAGTGFDCLDLIPAASRWLVEEGWLEVDQDKVRLADKSLFVSNTVLAELV